MSVRLDEHILQKDPQVASRAPGVELPVFRAEQLAAPDAIKAGGLDGVDPFFEWNPSPAGPDVAPLLRDVASGPKLIQRIAEIDAENVILVHAGDLVRRRTAVPQMIEVENQSDFFAGGFFDQLDLLAELVERRKGKRFEIEIDAVRLANFGQHLEVVRRQLAHLGPGFAL